MQKRKKVKIKIIDGTDDFSENSPLYKYNLNKKVIKGIKVTHQTGVFGKVRHKLHLINGDQWRFTLF